MIWHALDAARKAALACGAIAKASEWEPFRKAYLLREAKIESLRDIPKSGPIFAVVMAALEKLAGDGIRWNVRVDSGTADRAVAQHNLGEFLNENRIDHRWATGVARQALKNERIELHELDGQQTETVLGILRAQKRKAPVGKGVPF
jgi:hypothetical protein